MLPLALAVPLALAAGGAASTIYGVNRASRDQREANALNVAEAEKNRLFQAHERETSMQDMVRDMRLAGINPIHSAKLGGATQPSGAQATATNFDVGGKAVASGAMLMQQALTASQVEVNQAQARNLNAAADNQERSTQFSVAKLQQEVYTLDLDYQLKAQLWRQLEEMNPIAKQQAYAALKQLQLSNQHSKADLKRAFNEEAMEKFFDGPAGNWLRLLRGFFNSGAAK